MDGISTPGSMGRSLQLAGRKPHRMIFGALQRTSPHMPALLVAPVKALLACCQSQWPAHLDTRP
jgi:hypothetical protein